MGTSRVLCVRKHNKTLQCIFMKGCGPSTWSLPLSVSYNGIRHENQYECIRTLPFVQSPAFRIAMVKCVTPREGGFLANKAIGPYPRTGPGDPIN